MPREFEYYRDILADIGETFDKKHLTATDVGKYLGIDPRTAKKRYQFGKEGIPAPALARKLASTLRRY